MTGEQSAADLTHAYARWRSRRLGQITDALEQRLLLDMLGPLAGKTLLDVGCGDGALALELAHRGASVTGLDAGPAMIAAARRRSEASGAPLRFVEGRAERLPFEDATFDRVIAVAVLCLVGDAGRAVAEMARVLKPGGQLVIGDLGRWSLWAAQRRIRGWLGHPIWRATTFRSARQLCHLAGAAGLDVVQLRGAIHYPPSSLAARLLAPLDLALGRRSTIGAAFIALSAAKPLHS